VEWSFGFGLVHGFGFASATGMALVRGLVGFNAGLEIGQAVREVFMPALMLLARGRGARLAPRIAPMQWQPSVPTGWSKRILMG
jgi:hypothetical protein